MWAYGVGAGVALTDAALQFLDVSVLLLNIRQGVLCCSSRVTLTPSLNCPPPSPSLQQHDQPAARACSQSPASAPTDMVAKMAEPSPSSTSLTCCGGRQDERCSTDGGAQARGARGMCIAPAAWRAD